jgi:hypothetical protein
MQATESDTIEWSIAGPRIGWRFDRDFFEVVAKRTLVKNPTSVFPRRVGELESLYDELALLCLMQADHPDDHTIAIDMDRRLAELRRVQQIEAQQIDLAWRRLHPLPPERDDETLFQAALIEVNAARAPSTDNAPSDPNGENS